LVGKPSGAFFRAALKRLGLPPEQVAMIGDDIDSDVGGAQALGMAGILVKTGKYRRDYAERSAVKPDLQLRSIADLAL
jgi:ribonucleotide monophosphatase NagD (HAD superfamily)